MGQVAAPPGWSEFTVVGKKYFARIASVKESRLCEYTMVIETTSLCVDSSLIPRLWNSEGTGLIKCYAV